MYIYKMSEELNATGSFYETTNVYADNLFVDLLGFSLLVSSFFLYLLFYFPFLLFLSGIPFLSFVLLRIKFKCSMELFQSPSNSRLYLKFLLR